MDELESLLAIASWIAYQDIEIEDTGVEDADVNEKSKRKCQACKDLKAKEFPSLQLDRLEIIHANPYMFAMKDEANSRLIISIKGTTLSDVFDLWNDLLIFVKKIPERLPEVLSFATDAIRENQGYSLHFTGHSLGGTLAELAAVEFLARHHSDKIYCAVYNPFVNLRAYQLRDYTVLPNEFEEINEQFDAIVKEHEKENLSHVHIVELHINGDPISHGKLYAEERKVLDDECFLRPHTIDNFLRHASKREESLRKTE